MLKENYEVQVLVNRSPVREYKHEGRYFIEGRKDTQFTIKIKNNGPTRIVAIPTVDGLSVMDGKNGSLDSSGYIVDAHSSIVIDGWRVSDEEVAEFFFCNKNKSYSAKTGKGGNQGVIGVAVFREKFKGFNLTYTQTVKREPYVIGPGPFYNGDQLDPNNILMSSASSAESHSMNCLRNCSSSSKGMSKASADLGTGWGEIAKSSVTTVAFEKEDNVDSVFEIFYATRSRLKEMGVDLKTSEPKYVSAFPGNYCKPPQE